MRRPNSSDLPAEWQRAAKRIAEVLRDAGHRGWIVGGAVRDLALDEEVGDVDMASAALPDEVEALFPHTVAVGRAFGTLLIPLEGVDVQLTTFRGEQGYSDKRRPDQVVYGTSLEEDAARRDFTCNALFLDPLTDELVDPEGGLADLEAGRLRTVGDARDRFAEDGLRLLRLCRFAAGYGLEVEDDVLEAARASAASLKGVSAERIYQEFSYLFRRQGAARAVALLDRIGILAAALFREGESPAGWAAAERLARAHAVGDALTLPLLLAILFSPEHGDSALRGLRASRAVMGRVTGIWRDQEALANHLATDRPGRASAIRLVRSETWSESLALARAGAELEGADTARLEDLAAFAAAARPEELSPEPLLTSRDLDEAGVQRGPAWGELLARAEDLQLEGELATREEALAWLAQLGGNTRRNP